MAVMASDSHLDQKRQVHILEAAAHHSLEGRHRDSVALFRNLQVIHRDSAAVARCKVVERHKAVECHWVVAVRAACCHHPDLHLGTCSLSLLFKATAVITS